MRMIFATLILLVANLASAITPLGNTEGFVLVDLDKHYKFTLTEGNLVECVLNTGDPKLKIETCKLDGASIDIDGTSYVLTHLVRNFFPLADPGRIMYQYQYVGIWEKKLPDFTFRYKMLVTLNLPGLNTPRFGGFIAIDSLGFNWQLGAKKS